MVDDSLGNKNTDSGLKQMLQDSEDGCFELILVTTIDRVIREAGEMLKAIEDLERRGVAVVSVLATRRRHALYEGFHHA